MNDLINRKDAIDAINTHFGFNIDEEYGSAVQEVINGLPSAQPEQWIPVSERLPEEEVQVLVTDDAGGLATRETIRCNQCRFYEGVHNAQGCAPCTFWGIGAVMWDDFCKRGERYGSD